MRALRCQGGFVTAPRAGPAALSCPPPPRESIVPGPSRGCWRQIYRGRRPAGRGLRSAAGRGAGGSAPGTFDPSCCHRRGRRGPRGRIPLRICFARPVRDWLLFFFFSLIFFVSGAFCPQLRGGLGSLRFPPPGPGINLCGGRKAAPVRGRLSHCFYSHCTGGFLRILEGF